MNIHNDVFRGQHDIHYFLSTSHHFIQRVVRGERLPIITGCIPTGDSINFDLKRFYTKGNAGLRHISTIMPNCPTNQLNQNEGTVQPLTNTTSVTNEQTEVQLSMAVMKIA